MRLKLPNEKSPKTGFVIGVKFGNMRRMSDLIQQDQKKRILLVDDHAFVRQGLRDFIEREPGLCVCGETSTRAEALQLCVKTNPHLVVIDLSLGEDSGLDLVKDITVQFPGIKMLVLSMQDEMLYAERVLRAGASGFVSKNTPPGSLIEAISCVLGGGVHAS
ncbi:MAG: response regulator transcription factor, partial [Kiritimatiellales bacterium]